MLCAVHSNMEHALKLRLPWLLLLIALLVHPFPVSQAEIISASLHNDSRGLIEIGSFGFTSRGNIDLQVSDVWWANDTDAHQDLLGFFLTSGDAGTLTVALDDDSAQCVLQTNFITPLFTFKDLNRSKEFHRNFAAPNANRFALIFANCLPGIQVSLNLRASFYNLEGKDGTKDYLPDGLTQLPTIYFSFFVMHICLFIAWIYVCLKQKLTTHRIHILMGVLVFVKALYLFSEAEDTAYTKRTGTPHGWDIAFYILSFLKGVMLFTVIVLIGAGWSILKPHLQDNEKWVLMVVIPLQVLANVAEVVIGETGPSFKEWLPLGRLMFLVDVICCCAVLFPIIWSIKRLRQAAHTDGKAARNLVKLILFRQYYMVVVCYIYFTRFLVLVLAGVTAYRYLWLTLLAFEIATLAFYVFTGYKFRPAPHNPYFVLENEEGVVTEDFKDEDFEL